MLAGLGLLILIAVLVVGLIVRVAHRVFGAVGSRISIAVIALIALALFVVNFPHSQREIPRQQNPPVSQVKQPDKPAPQQVSFTAPDRFCGKTSEHGTVNIQRDSSDPTEYKIDPLQGDCFAGPFVLPKSARTYNIDRSNGVDDWTRAWCDGQSHPGPVRRYYEDFRDEFKDCNAFYFEGKGSVLVTVTSWK